ncbi:ImmA/IrrE family metallo-endopeptidase [Oceanobacillus oncorhynchi subsp. incaldanensis]|uniref:ImmA/IrrE family metallo-endopeptidase n=1 Tax=Oceanobacillus oncorhynchi TaxID=545501 RepID=UPI001B06F1F9|nr:ImmA/IrrE family metallo-endopeptidase [Oceanobacillus oncorhynchi]GIO18100.1 ImmA/IrrE family metallo-endopeptidase [Oceanobacillus oncorhynchi subsp. incaldanensis]
MTIKKRVNQLFKKYGTTDPIEIAKAKGIPIIYRPLGSQYGFFTNYYRTFTIQVNEDMPYKKQLYTIMHELGHISLHPEINSAFLKANTYYMTDRYETEAHEFAIEMFYAQEEAKDITIKEAIEEYGVPEELLKKKFYS